MGINGPYKKPGLINSRSEMDLYSDFYDPPRERVDSKKNNSLEYTYIIKYHYVTISCNIPYNIQKTAEV